MQKTQSTTTPDPADRLSSGDIARTLLWMAVVASALTNMALSFGGAHTWVHLVCGAVTVLCAGALVVRNLRGRR
ncbi:hypothetical protein [Streptomyces sp. NPDC005538]|uniref:hypothetical protein n=1 Tax=unclassified Streptomyces TaxID=2593676 RepID=UPI0033AB895B